MRLLIQSLVVAAFVLLLQSRLIADPIKMDAIIHLDDHCDGTLEVKTHLDAPSWRVWELVYGNHPDLIFRNLKRQYAGSEIVKSSYHLDKDELNRVADARMQGRGVTLVQKDGSLAFSIPAPVALVSHTGHEWIFNLNTPKIQETLHLFLPEGETDARIQYADTAEQRLVYRLPAPRLPGILLISTIIAGCLGIALLAASFFAGKRGKGGLATGSGDGASPEPNRIPASRS